MKTLVWKTVDSSRLNIKPCFSSSLTYCSHCPVVRGVVLCGFSFNEVVHLRQTSLDRRPLSSSSSLVAVADLEPSCRKALLCFLGPVMLDLYGNCHPHQSKTPFQTCASLREWTGSLTRWCYCPVKVVTALLLDSVVLFYKKIYSEFWFDKI